MKFTVQNYIEQHNSVIQNLDSDELEEGIKLITDTFKKGKRIAVCGNGGSAGNAIWIRILSVREGVRPCIARRQ